MSSWRVVGLSAVIIGLAAAATGQTPWYQHPANPVLGPGTPGSWDDGGRWVSEVVFDGSRYHLWFSGGHDMAVGQPMDIGHATSVDGLVWVLDPANPVLRCGDPGEWDEAWILGASVLFDGATFHMWYGAGNGEQGRGGYAVSADGSAWTKYAGNPVLMEGPPGRWDEQGAVPTSVRFDGAVYRMWYTGYRVSLNWEIGYAESYDGIHWIQRSEPVLEPFGGGWESDTVSNPEVVFDGTVFHMWYTGSGLNQLAIGYAWSDDGVQWTRSGLNPVITVPAGLAFMSEVVFDCCTTHMWFSEVETINYAVSHAAYAFRADIQFCDGFESGDLTGWVIPN